MTYPCNVVGTQCGTDTGDGASPNGKCSSAKVRRGTSGTCLRVPRDNEIARTYRRHEVSSQGKEEGKGLATRVCYLLTEKRPNPPRASTTEAVKRLTPVMMQLPPPVHMGGWANMYVNGY